jgi:hypothetical protein
MKPISHTFLPSERTLIDDSEKWNPF